MQEILKIVINVKDTLKILAKEGNGLIRGSFHSYTGSIKMLNQILDLGCMLI